MRVHVRTLYCTFNRSMEARAAYTWPRGNKSRGKNSSPSLSVRFFGTSLVSTYSISSFSRSTTVFLSSLQEFHMANHSDCFSDESTRYSIGEDETSIEEVFSDTEVSPRIEALPSKRSRKVPARFKDAVCTPGTTKNLEEFDAVLKDSKSLENTKI